MAASVRPAERTLVKQQQKKAVSPFFVVEDPEVNPKKQKAIRF